MSLIRSKLRLNFPKSCLKPFFSSFSTTPQNPNFSDVDVDDDDDDETHEIESNFETPVVEKFNLSSKDQFTKPPNFTQNPNPNLSDDNDDDDDNDNDDDSDVSSDISPQETKIVNGLHLLIKEHFIKKPKYKKIPNPNFKISHLELPFSDIATSESISPSVVASVIEKCRSVRHGVPFVQALSFFNWAVGQERENLERFGKGFVEMVDLAGKVQEFDVAWGLIDDVKRRQLDIPPEVFVRLIRRYARANMVPEATLAFHRMVEYGCKPDNAEFTAVMTILVKKRKAAEAQAFFDGLKDKFKPDVVVYSILANGWFRVGNIPEAEKVLREMKMKGIEPNVYTYTTIIDGLCRHGQITRAHDVFAEMIEKGCQPNVVTFNNLIRVHAKAGKTEKVLQAYNQMKRLGCQPDVVTYNYLIDCYGKGGNRVDAMKSLHQMVSKGIEPNVHSFNPIFGCIAQSRDVNAAHKLFKKMKELNCKPNTLTYNILLQMCVSSKSTDMVFKLKEEMDDLEVEVNVNTYRIMITFFCGMGHWSNAYNYFCEMVKEKHLKPSRDVSKMVIRQLGAAGQLKKQGELLKMMAERGIATRRM